MIHSMTGYATQTLDTAGGRLSLELKSVNSRFLDMHFRFVDELRGFEQTAREKIAARVRRGKVECRFTLTPQTGRANPALQAEWLASLKSLETQVREILPEARPLRVVDILHWPGVLGEANLDVAALVPEFAALMDAALAEFLACRAREGEKLATVILESVRVMRRLLDGIKPRIPAAQAALAEKLRQRLGDALKSTDTPVDEDRILQEVTLFAARIDVAEELARLATHLAEVERILATGGPVGKRLDFLMQELNREANTLASKAAVAEITSTALEMKLQIEQMREQVQNIE
ncbi:MAG: YicC family protein [Zoogloeaceae bacterium]|jgi:uncharacterized protein (TIGR00255 family)|nr:YicC family protein [Zoogloeaceae bacterium]